MHSATTPPTVRPEPRFSAAARQLLLAWERPLWAFLFALAAFFTLALTSRTLRPWQSTPFAYFNYLADAFLHGQLWLRLLPTSLHDLISYQGHYALYWGPMPAVLLMPLVALFGVGISDILETILMGALCVGLFALLLRKAVEREVIALNPTQRALLVLFLALGTVLTTLPPAGKVWFFAQLTAFFFSLLAYLAAFSFKNTKAFFLAGCAMAGVFATRSSAIFIVIFLAWYLLRTHWQARWKRLIGYCLAAALPVLVVAGLLGAYNLARFGSPLNTGLDYHQMDPFFQGDFDQYGLFNLHYIPTNFYYHFIYYPFPARKDFTMGGSLFLLSPLFFAALYALWQNRRQADTWALLLSIVLGDIPIITLMGTGWVQFGPRYTLDFTLPLLLLTALGMQHWSKRAVAALVGIACLHYFMGTVLILNIR